MKKFEETGIVTNIGSLAHHRFAHSAENIAIVSENVAEDRMCLFLVVLTDDLTVYYGAFCI